MANNYEQLVKALRHCSGQGFLTCRECQYNNNMLSCAYKMMRDAAAAIEALQAEVKRMEDELSFSESSADEFQMQAALQNALLAKQLPKRGEWKPFDLTYGRSIYSCSVCEQATEVPMCMEKPMYAYCPNCGAKMEVQDDG